MDQPPLPRCCGASPGRGHRHSLSSTPVAHRHPSPAPGYPACPDHLEKDTIWALLDVEKIIGVTLTESKAMWPAAAVSGYYFANPESKYFGLGKVTEEQVIDYAQRKGISKEMAMKWLQPNLSV